VRSGLGTGFNSSCFLFFILSDFYPGRTGVERVVWDILKYSVGFPAMLLMSTGYILCSTQFNLFSVLRGLISNLQKWHIYI
jgi:hypothetical protein